MNPNPQDQVPQTPTPSNLAQDWPEDPINPDLAQTAQDLLAARPHLSQLALDRIQIQLSQELDRQQRAKKWRPVLFLLVALLALIFSITASHFFKSGPQTISLPSSQPITTPTPIEDTYPLTLSFPATQPSPQVAIAPITPDHLNRALILARQEPTVPHLLGLQEMQRTSTTKLDPAQLALLKPTPPQGRESIDEIALWRSLPLAAKDPGLFTRQIADLTRHAPRDPWLPIFKLYLASAQNNRALTIQTAATITETPASFPTTPAEQAHFDLLRELNVDEVSAGYTIITHRDFTPLQSLTTLDQFLTSEIAFFKGTTKAAQAKSLESTRDKLRQAWLDLSKHQPERLFALNLLGRKQDIDSLQFAAKELPWLNNPADLLTTLKKLDARSAYTQIIEPLLQSEVKLIQSPPQFQADKKVATTLTITAKSKSTTPSQTIYTSQVKATFDDLTLTADQLIINTPPTQLQATGHITLTNSPNYPLITADAATYTPATASFTITGNVTLKSQAQQQSLKSATLTRSGELRDITTP